MDLRLNSRTLLILYNLSREKFEEFGVEVDSNYGSRMITCVESLVAL